MHPVHLCLNIIMFKHMHSTFVKTFCFTFTFIAVLSSSYITNIIHEVLYLYYSKIIWARQGTSPNYYNDQQIKKSILFPSGRENRERSPTSVLTLQLINLEVPGTTLKPTLVHVNTLIVVLKNSRVVENGEYRFFSLLLWHSWTVCVCLGRAEEEPTEGRVLQQPLGRRQEDPGYSLGRPRRHMAW